MSNDAHDRRFAGSIPELYERHLVPLIFAPYASDLVRRLAAHPVRRVLEVAAGTGVVTREMARVLPPGTDIVATDLNPAMLDEAARIGTVRPVRWEPADAAHLPLPDASVDAVLCQFGVMFFPDKPAAYAEMRRVLRPGGVLLFNVWDRIETSEFADVVTRAMERLFPDDPPRFLARTPHGHGDPQVIVHDLAAAGFERPPRIECVTERSRAPSAESPAIAYCQGTPLRNEIEARDASRLGEATRVAAQAIAARFGAGPVDGMIQALVVEVMR